MSSEAILEKPVVRRKPKERLSFFKRQKEETSFIDMFMNIQNSLQIYNEHIEVNDRSNIICPYTDFIPLSYLFASDIDFLDVSSIKYVMNQTDKFCGKQLPNDFIPNLFARNMHNHGFGSIERILGVTNDAINKYINNNEFILLDSYIGSSRGYDFADFIASNVHRSLYAGRLITLSYLHNSLYYLRNDDNPKFIPTFISVVLPENYIYQKYHMLMTGKIDPTKVIVLVNDDVDHPSFKGSQTVRKAHKAKLNNIINQGYQVWNVPEKFILDSCFVNFYKIQGKSRTEIQKKVEELIDEFNEYMTATHNVDGDTPVLATDPAITDSDVSILRDGISTGFNNVSIGSTTGSSTYYSSPGTMNITASTLFYTADGGSTPVYLSDGSSDLTNTVEESAF